MSRRRSSLTFALALAVLASIPSIARAGEPKTHDGFFLRLSAGGGMASTEIESSVASVSIDGTAGDLNIAIGGVITPNLALHGTLWGWALSDPDADITIPGLGSGSGTLDGDVSLGAVGAGATYYFMPANLYVSGSVGMGSLQLDSDQVDGETDSGFVVDLSVGKEWWVGNSWGLGVAGGFSYHSLPDPDIDENWSGTSFAVRFSATMN
jgi:hypothetical protein